MISCSVLLLINEPPGSWVTSASSWLVGVLDARQVYGNCSSLVDLLGWLEVSGAWVPGIAESVRILSASPSYTRLQHTTPAYTIVHCFTPSNAIWHHLILNSSFHHLCWCWLLCHVNLLTLEDTALTCSPQLTYCHGPLLTTPLTWPPGQHSNTL